MNRFFLLLIVTCLLFSGCQSYKRMQAKNPLAKNSPKSPTKMVDAWNTYAQTMPDGPPTRGVAGRVHFFNDAKKKQAVKVDGSMTVFVFDGEQKDPAHAKPIKVFQFKPETLSKHYSFKKPLGHGYDFFLPFDSIDGVERPLCVIARFDDSLEGTLVLSPPVNVLLKGSRSEPVIKDVMIAQTEEPVIQQVSHTTPSESPSKPDRNVSTITLNDNLTRRLAQAPPQKLEPPGTPPRPIESAVWTTETLPSAVPPTPPAPPTSPQDPLLDFPKIEFPKF